MTKKCAKYNKQRKMVKKKSEIYFKDKLKRGQLNRIIAKRNHYV